MRKIIKKFTTFFLFLLTLSFLLAFPSPSRAGDPPKIIHYQGRVKVNDVIPNDGNYPFIFRIYTQASGGTPCWTTTQTKSVTQGVFNVELSVGNSCSKFDSSSGYWLETVFNGTTLARERILSAPNAINSYYLSGWDGGDSNVLGDLRVESNLYTGGRAGIGTNSPTAPLQVKGQVTGEILNLTNRGYSNNIRAWVSGEAGDPATKQWLLGNGWTSNSSDFFIFAGNYGAGGDPQFTLKTNGNVGIGTTNPSYKLQVQGIGYYSSNLTVRGNLSVGNGVSQKLVTITGDRNAQWTASGINLKSADVGDSYDGDYWHMSFRGNNSWQNGGLAFWNYDASAGAWYSPIFMRPGTEGVVIGSGGNITLRTRHINGKHWQNDGDHELYLQYGNGYKVQIGLPNPNPNSNLEVYGSVYAEDGYTCAAGDLAEIVSDQTNFEAGDVVCISRNENEDYIWCEAEYDTTLAGAVSEEPGLLLNSQDMGDEGLKLALTGRVKVKVNTSNGPIQKGDMLVSSSRPGYAMKGNLDQISENPGSVVGKALESFNGDEGKILVLVK